jgi:thiol-disulfide isomerase/thioredoxin
MGAALALVGGTIVIAREPDKSSAKTNADAKAAPRLLWVRSKYNGAAKEKLVASEKLTVEEYRKRGVDVVELKSADLDKWREGEGKDYARAHKYLQYVTYGKGLNVQAVGGLAVFEITSDMEEDFEGKKAGDYFYGWGIALKGCESNFMFNLEGGDEPRAIPMALAEGDPWTIPQAIEARSCESSGKEPDFMAMMSKGKPFMGVMLEGKKVSNVIPGSPAESAGLAVGDELVSVGGKEIESLDDLAVLMTERKPGDEVEIAYERDGKRAKKTIKLADRSELEAKNSPDGKPLPALVGKDIDGREVRTADFKGKVVLLDFWATWCGPCIEEMPLMQLTWEHLKDKGLVWVGVSGDQDEEAWRDFVKDNRLGGIQLREESWGNALAVGGFPTILLVDRSGVVSCRVRGGTIAQAAAAMLQN